VIQQRGEGVDAHSYHGVANVANDHGLRVNREGGDAHGYLGVANVANDHGFRVNREADAAYKALFNGLLRSEARSPVVHLRLGSRI
jgi:hypothetical protein